jgi:hypothetical protein
MDIKNLVTNPSKGLLDKYNKDNDSASGDAVKKFRNGIYSALNGIAALVDQDNPDVKFTKDSLNAEVIKDPSTVLTPEGYKDYVKILAIIYSAVSRGMTPDEVLNSAWVGNELEFNEKGEVKDA